MHKAVNCNSNFTNNHNYHPFLLLKLSCGKKLQGKVALAKTGIMENLKKKKLLHRNYRKASTYVDIDWTSIPNACARSAKRSATCTR